MLAFILLSSHILIPRKQQHYCFHLSVLISGHHAGTMYLQFTFNVIFGTAVEWSLISKANKIKLNNPILERGNTVLLLLLLLLLLLCHAQGITSEF